MGPQAQRWNRGLATLLAGFPPIGLNPQPVDRYISLTLHGHLLGLCAIVSAERSVISSPSTSARSSGKNWAGTAIGCDGLPACPADLLILEPPGLRDALRPHLTFVSLCCWRVKLIEQGPTTRQGHAPCWRPFDAADHAPLTPFSQTWRWTGRATSATSSWSIQLFARG